MKNYQFKSNIIDLSSHDTEYDFRNTMWGMTKAEVKLSEKAYPLTENETHITYRDTLMGLETTVGFHFMDDSLIEAGYAFCEAYYQRDFYIDQYDRIKQELTRIYGLPFVDQEVSKNQLSPYAANSDDYSQMFFAEWISQRSVIRLVIVNCKSSSEFGVLHVRRDHNCSKKVFAN